MYLNSTARRTLLLGGLALLVVVGLVAWNARANRTPAAAAYSTPGYPAGTAAYPAASNEPNSAYPNYANSQYSTASAGSADRATGYTPGNAYGNTPVVYSASPFGSSLEPPPPAPAPVAEYEPAPPDPEPVRSTVRGSRVYTPRTRVYTKKRPLKHSLAIVGGSAAGGAAVGAIAGGGKGAGIGALVGGAGGFIYDRLTHKKRVVVER